MNWSLRVGRLLGIPLYIHWTFAILLGWILFARMSAGATFLEALGTIGFVLALFGCVILHELGHAVAARGFGVPTRDITLLPIGGLARLERMPEEPTQELVIAIAGPLVNVVIAAGLLGAKLALGGLGSLTPVELIGGHWLDQLLYINIALVLFNMLPAFPMDGGRALRAILATKLDYVNATRVAANLGIAMAVLFGLAGLMINPLLIFIALFVGLGAQAEARHVEVRSLVQGTPVRDAMVRRVRTLSPQTTLGEAAEALLEGAQQDFPITEDGEVVGMLIRADLIRGLSTAGPKTPVSELMRREFDSARESDMLDGAMTRMRSGEATALPVLRGRDLVGMITMENVGEWMMIRSAQKRRRQRGGAV
ncbi:MAG: site-2 protease family protein [Phycisphaerales bacterium JB039]